MNIRKISQLLLLLTLSGWVVGCSDDEDNAVQPSGEGSEINQFVYTVMQDLYLWKDEVPTNLNLLDFETPEELVEATVFKDLDRWTYIRKDNGETLQRFQEGTRSGLVGISSGYDPDGVRRIAYVLPNSPAEAAGLQRGFKVLKINGTAATQGTSISIDDTSVWEIEDLEGNIKEYSLTKGTFNEKAILHQEVKTVGETKIAYLVFRTFIDPAEQELKDAFAFFQAEGATELVVDLRYNGGGLTSIAAKLGSMIAGPEVMGSVFAKMSHNENYSERFDSELLFEDQGVRIPNLERVVFITTGGTASSSELVINGLAPFMDVTLVGQTTSGKYVGAYVLEEGEYSFVPIALKTVNALGRADFINGFEPNLPASDDLTHGWGDVNEEMFAQALNSLTGAVSGARFGNTDFDPQVEVLDEELPMIFETPLGGF